MTRVFFRLLLVNLSCIAQDFTKHWIYLETIDEQKRNADIVDVWEYYIQNPINLNDSTELYRIRELNLLSEKDLNLITSHCPSQQLISIYQLQTLEIQIEALKRIKDFIYIPIKNAPITTANKSTVYVGLLFQTPQRNGTINNAYIGSPIKSHIRYRTTLKKAGV